MPDASINGTSFCNRSLTGGSNIDGECSAATLATLGPSGNKIGMWGTVFPYGDIVGKSVCSATAGTNATAATDAQESSLTTEFNAQTGNENLNSDQKHCWCKMESVNGESAVSRWVFYFSELSASDCAYLCANECGRTVRSTSAMRSGLFGSVN